MAIHLFWWRGKGAESEAYRNFGDWMSPLICEALSKKPVLYADPETCELMAMGSIMIKLRKARRFRRLPFRRRVHVWGSGALREKEHYWGGHYYHAVRGAKTAGRIKGLSVEPAYGDPGLLCEILLSDADRCAPKQYAVGIIPHYMDQGDRRVAGLVESNPHVEVINVFDPVIDILKKVCQCEFILSSSLHGLVVADALGVPNQWIKLSGMVKGDDFKFGDYYSIYGIGEVSPYPLEEGISEERLSALISDYTRPGLAGIQERLRKAFPFPA